MQVSLLPRWSLPLALLGWFLSPPLTSPPSLLVSLWLAEATRGAGQAASKDGVTSPPSLLVSLWLAEATRGAGQAASKDGGEVRGGDRNQPRRAGDRDQPGEAGGRDQPDGGREGARCVAIKIIGGPNKGEGVTGKGVVPLGEGCDWGAVGPRGPREGGDGDPWKVGMVTHGRWARDGDPWRVVDARLWGRGYRPGAWHPPPSMGHHPHLP